MIEVEIWTSGKAARQGTGMIVNVLDWNCSERVNEAAQWSFTMPAEDAMAGVATIGREAYGYLWERGNRICVFGGEILELRRREVGDGGVNLEVSGLGKLNDLNYQYVDEYVLWEEVSGVTPEDVQAFDSGSTDKPNIYDGDTGTWSGVTLDATATPIRYMYIRYNQPFWELAVTVEATATGDSTLTAVQYYNRITGWEQVDSLSDGTLSGGFTFKVSGSITFTQPTDWDSVVHDGKHGYWLRLTSGSSISIAVQEITLTTRGRHSTDITQLVTDNASGMSVIATGGGYFGSTANGYYGTISNTSTLGALRRIADIEDGMFRIYAHDDARLAYMRGSGISTGLYAVGPSAPSPYTTSPNDQMLITGIDQAIDAREVVNRLYAFGSGNGRAARITLAGSDAAATAGYTRSEADSYIEQDAGSPRKSAGKYFPEVKDIEGSIGSPEAANMLLELAENELLGRVSQKEHLTLELVHLPQILRPGDKINVLYRRRATPTTYGVVNYTFYIEGEYTVTQVRHSVVNGVLVANVTASNVNRPPLTIDEVLYRMVESLGRQLATPQVTRGADLSGPGVPVL